MINITINNDSNKTISFSLHIKKRLEIQAINLPPRQGNDLFEIGPPNCIFKTETIETERYYIDCVSDPSLSTKLINNMFNIKPQSIKLYISNYDSGGIKASLSIQCMRGLVMASIIFNGDSYCAIGELEKSLLDNFGGDISYTNKNIVRKIINIWINCEELCGNTQPN